MKQIIFIFLLSPLTFFTQKVEATIYGLSEKPENFTSSNFNQAYIIANNKWLDLIEAGFLSASIDSFSKLDSSRYQFYFYKGNKFDFKEISTNIPSSFKSELGFKENYFKKKTFSPSKLKILIKNTLSHCNNNGYPFASINLMNSKIIDNNVQLDMNLNLGPLILVDSIITPPDIYNQKRIIEQIINIRPGDIFNQELINAISTRIKETPFLIEAKPPEYEFINNKVLLFINAKNKPANFINGIIGIQPQSDGAINITGDANLKFINAIKKGETFSLNWKKMYALSQSLNTKIELPFLLNSSFGAFNYFDMLKKDTTFFNLNNKIGASYTFSEKTRLGLYYYLSKSNILQSNYLSNFNNTSVNSLGFFYELNRLDYKYNPRKGYYSKCDFQLGNKNVYTQQDSMNIKSNSTNYQFEMLTYVHIPIGSKSTLKIGGSFASILNPLLYENELFRIGGNKLLRGFDEETLWVSSYAIGTIEYRFLLEQNSNIFTFLDIGWNEQKLTDSYENDMPYGIGIGINFETKPGIFSISYALGSQQQNPLLLKTAKIHFGFINFF